MKDGFVAWATGSAFGSGSAINVHAVGTESKHENVHTWEIEDSTVICMVIGEDMLIIGDDAGNVVVRRGLSEDLVDAYQFKHERDVNALALCGNWLASGGTDNMVHVWDLHDGHKVHSYEHENWVYAVAMTEQFIASGAGRHESVHGLCGERCGSGNVAMR